MAVRKKKKKFKNFDLFYDILVKMANIFKDCYIIKRKYVIGGDESEDDSLGNILLTLEEKYEKSLEYFKLPDIFKISSIKELKTLIKPYPDEMNLFFDGMTEIQDIEDEILENICYDLEVDLSAKEIIEKYNLPIDLEKIREKTKELAVQKSMKEFINPLTDPIVKKRCKERLDSFFTDFEGNFVWEKLSDKKELIDTIFNQKRIYELKIPNSDHYITVAKQLFPLVTEKNMEEAYICLSDNDEFGLYTLRVDFMFTHFRIQAIYHCIPLNPDV